MPILSDPPLSVVDALTEAAMRDPAAAKWVIDLDRFYQKQEIIKPGI